MEYQLVEPKMKLMGPMTRTKIHSDNEKKRLQDVFASGKAALNIIEEGPD